MTDDESDGNSGHQAIIDDSWLRAREYIRRAEASDMDPTQVLWPIDEYHTHYEPALHAHTATIQFRDDIYAFRQERTRKDMTEMWQKTLTTIELDGQTLDVSLANVDNWAHKHYSEVHTKDSVITGETQIKRKYRVLLPVSACRHLYRQMQDMLHELGLTAETKDITPENEAKPEHLYGLLDQRSQSEAKKKLPERFKKNHSETES